MIRILIVGAGFSGAVVARQLAEAGHACLVIDEWSHVAGNCHTYEDPETGVLVHGYGPHIFHTDDETIWRFVGRFGEWLPYRHSVFATHAGRVYGLPITLHTINQFFGTAMGPQEARAFVAARCVPNPAPSNFREQALAMVGPELYEAFLCHYTTKQWGVEPERLPASILKRLPLRFSYDSRYFHHQRQAMPRDGYTAIVAKMLDHPLIERRLGARAEDTDGPFAHTFYSGAIDRYFGYRLGRLGYRTLRFEELRVPGDAQGCPIMNYPDPDVPWTRITDHGHLCPWRKPKSDVSILWREYPEAAGPGSTLFYPLRLAGDEALIRAYADLARAEQRVTFLGRLGCYAYIDMDAAVGRALKTADAWLEATKAGTPPPVFVHDPVGGH